MPPALHPQPTAPAALDQRALDRGIATLLLSLDLVAAAVGDQPGPTTSSAAGGTVAVERAGYDPAVHQQPNPAAEPTPLPRVLIVDDAPAMRAALRGLLEDHGLAVIGEAADGLQAVTLAADLQPDVVVMDVRMPGLDGLQATTRITGAHPNIRVVVYSVFDTE
jgi:Response regulator receiver domain